MTEPRDMGTAELIMETLLAGFSDAAAKVKNVASSAISGAKVFAVLVVGLFIASLVVIYFGIESGSRSMVFTGTIMEAISAGIMATTAALIGALFGSKGLFRFVWIFFTFRLVVALLVLITPDSADLSQVAIMLFASLVIGSLNASENKFFKGIAYTVFIGSVISMFIPSFSDTLTNGLGGINSAMETSDLAEISRSEIDNRTFKFYTPKGQPKYWYVITNNKQVELYTKGGYEQTYRIKRKPIDEKISNIIIARGSGVISPRNFSGSYQTNNPPPRPHVEQQQAPKYSAPQNYAPPPAPRIIAPPVQQPTQREERRYVEQKQQAAPVETTSRYSEGWNKARSQAKFEDE